MKKVLYCCLLLVLAGTICSATTVAPDPTRISQGARVLGMGKAFIGLSDDVNAIFMNPAGLADISRWQVTSMTGKILEEFNYVTLSGVYPTNFGQVGIAFAGSSIGNAFASQVVSGTEDTPDPIYEFNYSLTPMSYFNNVFVVSYANRMAKLMELPYVNALKRFGFLNNFEFGTNLKFFSTGVSGASISGADGSGYELDLGLKYILNDIMSFGFVLENTLPASVGGKLSYGSGHDESFPMQMQAGGAFNVLGDKGRSFFQFMDQKVTLLFDLDTYPTRASYPYIYHMGVEWTPLNLITIRAGLDQDATEDESGSITTVSNLTAGVSLAYRDFRFDYGYHEFAGAPGITNSFFSLTYGIPWEHAAPNYMTILQPKDATITREAEQLFKGETDILVRYVAINNAFVPLKKDGSFEKTVMLDIAKNKTTAEAFDVRKNLLETDYVRQCRLLTFPDVPSNFWASDQISYIGTLGIITGYPDGTFKPDGNITRAELAAVLSRTLNLSGEARSSLFKDVTIKHWAAPYIIRCARLGVVKGYPDKTFRPKANITRAEGLAMIARFTGVPEIPYMDQFPDIDDSHWAARIISGASKAGILKYLENKMFDPNRKLTRAEAVEMLYRTKYVQDLINNDLLNWETY
ncbi:MAG: S-layer homology domain-containing protein [Candidatus Margulisbacteria bacterium]|nr:S-layer homology domain-containing protein [Candidatus Margulisiibacteriota bacterium]